MQNAPIRLLIILGSLTLIGILFSQIFWVSKAVSNQEEEFNHAVQMSLRNVAESLCELNGNDISNDPIDQISSNYFIARTNYSINVSSLEYLLVSEFQKRNLKEDFEFGVYDCQTERMVYSNFISFNGESQAKRSIDLPKLQGEEYYFGVYFPDKSGSFLGGLGFWKITSVFIILITLFFSYAMYVILQQKRLSEIQKDFINNMTHEFKTPLATLILSSEVLKSEASSDRGKKYAEIIKSESLRLQSHVTRFLETTSLDFKNIKPKVKIDVHHAITEVADRFQPFEKKITLDFSSQSAFIVGDPENFQNIIFNLIENAVKYGSNWVKVTTVVSGQTLKIIVSNDGVPILQNHQKKIFQKFYRISHGDRHDTKGFGLGLFFVQKGIKSFNGNVSVYSSEQQTDFILSIPSL